MNLRRCRHIMGALSIALASPCAPLRAEPVHVEIASVGYIPYVRGGRDLTLTLTVSGLDPERIRATRAIVSRAEDGAGSDLKPSNPPAFLHNTVGSRAGDKSGVTSKQQESISIRLTAPPVGIKTLKVVEGTVELIVPDLDPSAVIVIDGISAKFGVPIQAPALHAGDMTMTLFDKATCEKFRADPGNPPGGPRDFDAGPMFGERQEMSPEMAKIPALVHMYDYKETDFAVGVLDPHERWLGLEFQARDGAPLPYNHNGNYHSNGRGGKRFDIFHLPQGIPPDARCVCWVITEKATITVPFKFTDVALPAADAQKRR